MLELEGIFGDSGAISKVLPRYWPRESQLACAQQIAQWFADNRGGLIEAPTGCGKSLAYLIAGLSCNERLLVVTATKALQQQLLNQDIPIASQALQRPISAVALKGRRNYLCPQALVRAQSTPQAFSESSQQVLWQLDHWYFQNYRDNWGDLELFRAANIPTELRRSVTTSHQACTGAKCPKFSECGYQRLQESADSADVLVVNQHWLLSLFAANPKAIAESGLSERAVILDEAHRLPSLGWQLLSQQSYLGWVSYWPDWLTELVDINQVGLNEQYQALQQLATTLVEQQPQIQESPLDWLNRATGWFGQLMAVNRAWPELLTAWPELEPLAQQTHMTQLTLECAMSPEQVITVQVSSDGAWPLYRLVDSTPKVRWQQLWQALSDAKVLISASLAAGEDFGPIKTALSLEELPSQQLALSFNYQEQALLLYESSAPDISDTRRVGYLTELIESLACAAQGRTLALFTSLDAMKQVATALHNSGLNVLVQGQFPPQQLLQRFRLLGNCVLLASRTFWQGIDLDPGNLRCTLIDKLPFLPPDAPELSGLQASLGLPDSQVFEQIALPLACWELKQGAGRLIRREKQRGLLVICDPRIHNRDYGQKLLTSLPPMPRTQNRDQAFAFLRELQ
ncbi:ATP-dependent DNA helicase [Paraferrimonas sedimenticola]|uniref:ATP-dependent DNA helicase n=1 Tax=Paraferrimonas sedimenticola TaxID=375674 RepID=UPI001473455D|nr:ATP-dependent DNA helicase [Paraferrimonas sedimenticola]